MTTYGHESYIKQAVESVLVQECDFKIELIIANDGSPDDTDSIVKEILNTHPKASCIKYTRHQENKGMMSNFIWSLEQCQGKYIALLDGDDYWNDPLKLQKQVDFLEKNEAYSICFHEVQILENGKIETDKIDYTKENLKKINKKEPLNICDLLKNNFIHTPSVVFRKSDLPKKLPFEMYQTNIGDYFLYVMLTINNQLIHKLDDAMAVYRKGVGAFSGLTNFNMSYKVLKSSICVVSYLENDAHKAIQLNKIMNQIEYINARESSKVNLDTLSFIELLKLVWNRFMKKFQSLLFQHKS